LRSCPAENRTEAIDIIRGLTDRIVVHSKDDLLELELVNEIASMVEVAYGSENRKAAPLRNGFVCDGSEPTN
jgi:hypothetical protein